MCQTHKLKWLIHLFVLIGRQSFRPIFDLYEKVREDDRVESMLT